MGEPPVDGSSMVVSECTVFPDTKSELTSVRLFVSELPMLTLNYIQKGCLFSKPDLSDHDHSHLKLSLSKTLSFFPPLAGRLSTDPSTGNIFVSCTDAGALFVHARATSLHLTDILDKPYAPIPRFLATSSPSKPRSTTTATRPHSPPSRSQSFPMPSSSVAPSTTPRLMVPPFGTFFNTFADISRTGSPNPDISPSFPIHDDGTFFHRYAAPSDFRPKATFSGEEPTKERVFHFSREAMLALKKKANETRAGNFVEAVITTKTATSGNHKPADEISSFQSLCAQLWRSVTRARKLPPTKTTTFNMPVNCRQRVNPKMEPLLFGNVIQAIRTTALAGEVVSRALGWTAFLLHRGVVEHDDLEVRKRVKAVTGDTRCVPHEKSDGAMVLVGSSPRFPTYEVDFGWGRPVAVRSGKSNTFDGECTMFPGPEGCGSVDLELALAPEAMAGLETDPEFMQYVS